MTEPEDDAPIGEPWAGDLPEDEQADVEWANDGQVRPPAAPPVKEKKARKPRVVMPGDGHGDWRDRLITKSDGSPDDVPGNVTVALRFHPEWAGVIAFDEFQQTIVTVKPPPWGAEEAPPKIKLGPWTDADSVRLQTWMRRAPGLRLKVGRDAVDSALLVASEGNPVDPPREYLESLVWDGRPRIGAEASDLDPSEGSLSWLSMFLGVQDSAYVRRVGRWFLIASVARLFDPGCKVDNALVLEGPQGALKSTAVRVLYSPWYSDTPLDLASKDRFGSIQGVWGFELAEFDQYNRHDQAAIKAFASSPCDKFRPPYLRRDISAPRRCVFIATINPWGEYLEDATGGRRWWPVKCGNVINIDGLRLVRDQLWAEAVALYRAGERHYPKTTEEHNDCRVEQADRQMRDAWEDPIRAWLAGRLNMDVTVAEVLGQVLQIDKAKWGVIEQRRAGACLRLAGYERERVRDNGGTRAYVFRKVKPVAAE